LRKLAERLADDPNDVGPLCGHSLCWSDLTIATAFWSGDRSTIVNRPDAPVAAISACEQQMATIGKSQMDQSLFFVCRVLATKPDRLDYVIFQEGELARRRDVEVVSKGFPTEAAAEAAIKKLGGTIPDRPAMFLDFWNDENFETVWNWKDERTRGASQTLNRNKTRWTL
jgi:hypothetical protein